MKRFRVWSAMVLVALCVSVFGAVSSRAAEGKAPEGTSREELAERKLPVPAAIKVAVLPFWAYSSDVHHTRIGSSVQWLLFQHEGFSMIPLPQSFAAFDKDKEAEPGLALRKLDAQRLGKTLGADWVVYGEVRELRVYKKESFFRESRKVIAGLRIAVLDCKSGELFYWKTASGSMGGAPIKNKFDKLLRLGVLRVSETALTDLFISLPTHKTVGEKPDTGDIAAFMQTLWKDEE